MLNDEIDKAKKKAIQLKEEITKLSQVVNYLTDVAKQNQLTSEKLALYNNAVYTHNIKLKDLEKTNIDIAGMEEKLQQVNNCTMEVKSTIYTG